MAVCVCLILVLFFLAAAIATPQALLGMAAFATLSCMIPGLCALAIQQRNRRASAGFKIVDEYVKGTLYWKVFVGNANKESGGTEQDKVANWIDRNTNRAWVPIILIWLLSSLFSGIVVYSSTMLGSPGHLTSLLVLGDSFNISDSFSPSSPIQIALTRSLTAGTFAFLGWYVWSISSIFSRMISMELAPATYYTILMRLLAAVLVALALERIKSLLPNAQTIPPEAIGFAAGLFPDSVLARVTDLLQGILGKNDQALEELPLDLIQGISPFRRLRLHEMGLDNCQNLASANAVELYLMSNLKLVEVVDWIAQAQLAVLVHAAMFGKLQLQGYRNVSDFKRACDKTDARKVLMKITGFEEAQLCDLADGMAKSPSFVRLAELRERLASDKPGAA